MSESTVSSLRELADALRAQSHARDARRNYWPRVPDPSWRPDPNWRAIERADFERKQLRAELSRPAGGPIGHAGRAWNLRTGRVTARPATRTAQTRDVGGRYDVLGSDVWRRVTFGFGPPATPATPATPREMCSKCRVVHYG